MSSSSLATTLTSTEDSCPMDHESSQNWLPPAIVRQLFGVEDLIVIFFDRSIIRIVELDCDKAEHVGLTCIRLESDQDLLMCVTTRDKIFVFRLSQEGHAKYLKRLLKRDHLKYYIYQGAHVTYYLNCHFDIDLAVYRPIDLTTFDIYLSMRKYTLSGHAPNHHYTADFFFKLGIPKRNLAQLVEKHIGVKDLPTITKDEMESLKHQPLNEVAKNAIKKKAGLTRHIGLEMYMKNIELQSQESNNLYSFAIRATPEQMEVYDQTNDSSYDEFLKHLSSTSKVDV